MTILEAINRIRNYDQRSYLVNLGPLATISVAEMAARELRAKMLIQSMQDDLDGIHPLPKLKREVITRHLIPRKITRDELKRDFIVPVLFLCAFGSFVALVCP